MSITASSSGASDAGHENSNPAESTSQVKPTASTSSTSEKQPEPTVSSSTTADDTKPTTTTTTSSDNKETATTTTTSASSSATSSSSSSSSGYKAISGGISGEGHTTRYWDCCKASCSWPGKADVTSPVKTCAADGIKLVDANEQVKRQSYITNK